MKPIALGTLTVPTSYTEIPGLPPASQFANSDRIVLEVFGDQTEAVEFALASDASAPVASVASGAKDIVGPISARHFPRYYKCATGTDITMTVLEA